MLYSGWECGSGVLERRGIGIGDGERKAGDHGVADTAAPWDARVGRTSGVSVSATYRCLHVVLFLIPSI